MLRGGSLGGPLGAFWGPLGRSSNHIGRSSSAHRPSWGHCRPLRRRLGDILGAPGARLGPSWGLLRRSWGQAGARDGLESMEPVHPEPRIWGHFLPGRPKTQGLGHKNERILGSMRRGALIIASQGAKGPDTHLPLQARWRIYSFYIYHVAKHVAAKQQSIA